MKNRIISIFILSIMIVLFCVPILRSNFNNSIQVSKRNTYIKEVSESTSLKTNFDTYINLLKEGWTTANVNIRAAPSTDSDILGVYSFNEHIVFYEYDQDWVIIQIEFDKKEICGYMCSKYISQTECSYIEYQLPENSGFKSFMPYQSITDKTSKQYKLQTEYAYIGNYGIKQVNNRYCVAIGTAFHTDIGTYFDLILENGEVIQCIVSDIKDDQDTEINNVVTIENGCISEFIVDIDYIPSYVKIIGDISLCSDKWNSKPVSIKIYDKNVF